MSDKEFERTNLGNGFTVDGNNNYYYNGKIIEDDETLKSALEQQKICLEMREKGIVPVGDTGYYVDDRNDCYENDGSYIMSDLGQAKISEVVEDYIKKQKKAYEEIRSLSLPTRLMRGLSSKRLEDMKYWLPSELENFNSVKQNKSGRTR